MWQDVPVTQPGGAVIPARFCALRQRPRRSDPQELWWRVSRSPLDPLETAIGFHMRDWWQPAKANFFGHLKKPQIIAALNEAGLSGAARDAEKMKKGDAAEHAEFHMKDNRWVPGWMCAPRPQTDATERTGGTR